ncbi:hypothetical protein [Streptomyces griseus]|uniref:hypothetical protein n=1 Tax=Streptomyces griseus TaxID=1911 RepID=UPI00084010DA|nr:hypothetical protein [Streptomyces griseus]
MHGLSPSPRVLMAAIGPGRADGEEEPCLADLGISYSFRPPARGPHGETPVLGTDRAVHVIDPDTGRIETHLPRT